MLACWLWPPVMQQELNKFMNYANNHKIRKQKEKRLPSGVSPIYAYTCPNRFGGRECLQPVCMQVIEGLMKDLEPEMKAYSDWGVPREFADVAEQLLVAIGVPKVEMSNAWLVFTSLSIRLKPVG